MSLLGKVRDEDVQQAISVNVPHVCSHPGQRLPKAGSSYLPQNDPRIHFGLGKSPRAERLEILWPSGVVDVVLDIPANQLITVEEGAGAVNQQKLPILRAQ
jgi:hypothetical protein